MVIRILAAIAILVIIAGCSSVRPKREAGPELWPAFDGTMREHRAEALASVARNRSRMFQTIAARLRTGTDAELAWRQLDTMVASPTGDMFWMYPAAGFYFYCRDLLSDEWRERFRRAMKSYTPYRGDTENHFLMYYSTILLFSQEWPELAREDWFNGKSSAENYREAHDYIDHWIGETVRVGTTEWDSPRYLYFYLTPLLTLYDFTKDEALKKRVGMMIEYQLADYAAEYLEGSYVGAHSRDGDNSVTDPRNSEARSYGEFYFEDSLRFTLPDLAYAAMSRFECPAVIRAVARDRRAGFVHREMKRSRAKIRFSESRYTPVYKYDYITPEYAIGSIQGGLQQPIQQHSWGITFAARRAQNTIFGLHPYFSGRELGTFFPEEPELMVAGVAASKGSYVSEGKWIGGSPYERIVQDSNILVALYRIDSGASYQHIDLFIPRTLDTVVRDTSGWIVGRMGDAFAAIYPMNGAYEWIEEKTNWRVRMPARREAVNGYVVICGSTRADEHASFDAFRRWVTTKSTVHIRPDGELALDYMRPNGVGVMLRASPGQDEPRLSVARRGTMEPVRNQTDLLFDGPHLKSAPGSGTLRIECDGRRRVLDFEKGTVTEE